MCWGNPGLERPLLPVEECWEWRKEEHSQVSFVSHLTSAPQNTNTESEMRSRASSTSAGASLARTVTHSDICKNENIKRFPSCFAAVVQQSTRGCAHTVKLQCVGRLSVWKKTTSLIKINTEETTNDVSYWYHQTVFRWLTKDIQIKFWVKVHVILPTTRQQKQLLISLLQQFFWH